MIKKSVFFVGATLLAALGVGCTKERGPVGSEANPIKFFFLPSVDAKMLSDKAALVKTYLETNTPYKYSVAVPSSYVAVVEAFGTKRADVAAINTFGYLLAHARYGVESRLTVVRFGEETYKAQILTKTAGPIKTLEDLAGKKVAYVDPSSTSGYLMPAQLFKSKGIKLGETVFAKKHDNVVTMIYQGSVDAGATFYSPPAEGKIQDARRLVKTQFPDVEEKIKILALTDSIPNDPIAFRKELPEEIKTAIVNALMNFVKTQEGKDTFYALYGVTDLKLSTDSTYDGVRTLLSSLGMTADSLVK